MMDFSKYDAVLICNIEDNINEGYGDERAMARSGPGRDYGKVPYLWYDDPKLFANNAFGRVIQASLSSWRPEISSKVTDFGKWVTVDVTFHNRITGRSASKTFLIVFDGGPKGTDPSAGMVLSTANKWRTISGTEQAVSYIKSASAALESVTSQKL